MARLLLKGTMCEKQSREREKRGKGNWRVGVIVIALVVQRQKIAGTSISRHHIRKLNKTFPVTKSFVRSHGQTARAEGTVTVTTTHMQVGLAF